MKHLTRWIFVLLALTLTTPAWAFGPDGPHGMSPDKRAKMEAKMKEKRSKILREKVGLDEAKAKKVEQTLEKFGPKRRDLMRRTHEARSKLAELVKSDSNDQIAYRKVLGELRAGHKAMADLREKEMAALASQLTPKEQAKLAVAMHRIHKKMRGRGGKGHGWKHGGGGHGKDKRGKGKEGKHKKH